MKKKKPVSTKTVVAIGLLALVLCGVAGIFLFNPSDTSDISNWFKTNFFPADEQATTSLLDAEAGTISSQEYQGSTSAAWILCISVSAVVLVACVLFFARERGVI